MYKNIGRKIKGFAKFICAAGIIVSVLWGACIIILAALSTTTIPHDEAITLMTTSIISGSIIIIIGSLASWLGSLCLYGFGELIEKVTVISENTRIPHNAEVTKQHDPAAAFSAEI